MRIRTILILTLALALAVPSVAMAWGSKGQYEPSTTKDATDGLMWTGAPTMNDQVYFNAIVTTATAASTVYHSPNLATLETTVNPVSYYAVAMLGVWKDCNGDGYVGFGDNGLYEYRVELLLGDTTVCPPEEEPSPVPRGWKPVHNDGIWVREWLPIGWDTLAFETQSGRPIADQNIYNIVDWDARVWGDTGLPGAVPGNQCYILSHPKGTYDQPVGGLVGIADCMRAGQIEQVVGDVTTPTGTGPAWESAKATPNPWGRPRDGSAVDAFDCAQVLASQRVTQDIWVNVTMPKVPGATGGGSPAGTVNHVQEGTDDCDPESKPQVQAANLPYSTESDISNIDGLKIQTSYPMQFNEDFRPGTPNLGAALGGKPLKDGGTNVIGQGMWGSRNIVTAWTNPYASTTTLAVNPPQHATFYAYVSPAAVSAYGLNLPAGASAPKYGTEACGPTGIGAGKPDQNGWACDPAKWWPNHKPEEGKPDVTVTATSGEGTIYMDIRPGQEYQLRDIDCYDSSAGPLRQAGVHWGAITGTGCA